MVEKENAVKNLGMIPGFTRVEEARERAKKNVLTDKYSFGDATIDDYCGGGWGRHDAYEIVCVFGRTGVNKSTLTTQMIISPALKGDKVAYLALEDEIEDVINRADKQLHSAPGMATGLNESKIAQEKFDKVMQNVHFFPENHGYSLTALLGVLEELFKMYDVVVIDPIQFVFESSVIEKGETEWNRQRVFVNELQAIVRKAKKPLIFVSHTNKSAYNKREDMSPEGMIQGAGALPQIATKIIQISRDDDGIRHIFMPKTRFGITRKNKLQIALDTDMTIGVDLHGLTQQQIMDMKARW